MISKTIDTAPIKRIPPSGSDAYSIAEFCGAHGISQTTYFKMRREGIGPRVTNVYSRRLITSESAREWRESRTEQAA